MVEIHIRWFWFALFGVFSAMKTTGFVDWSWWWITSPLWLPFLVALIVLFLFIDIEK